MELLARLLPAMDDELKAETDIDLNDYDALLHIREAGPDGARMTHIADAIVVSKSGLTSLVDRLERRSLVERIPDPNDRRAILIRVTEDGEVAYRAAATVHRRSIHEHFASRLDDEEAAVIWRAIGRIVGEDRPEHVPSFEADPR